VDITKINIILVFKILFSNNHKKSYVLNVNKTWNNKILKIFIFVNDLFC